MENLSYTVVGTHKIEDAMLVCQTQGTFSHQDIKAEYKEDGKYQTFWKWEQEVRLDITSPTFTDVHLLYRADENNYSYSAASPAIGTVAMDLENNNYTLKWSLYYRPQVSPT